MRKRLLALLLCLCMAATFLPGTAWAAEPVDITETGLVIWAERNGSDGPTPSGTYKAGDGTLVWDLATLTITLNNATIDSTSATYGNALDIIQPSGSYPEITVVLNGTNTLTGRNIDTGAFSSCGLQCSACPLKIMGKGLPVQMAQI